MKLIILAAAVVSLAACQAGEPTVVTVTAPGPTVTVTAEPHNESQSALEYAWSSLTGSEKSDLCYVFNADAELAWEAFNESADNMISRYEFETFLNSKCASY